MIKKSIRVSISSIVVFSLLFTAISCNKQNKEENLTGREIGILAPDNITGIHLSLTSSSFTQYLPTALSNPVDRNGFAFSISSIHSNLLTELYVDEYLEDMWNYKKNRLTSLYETVEKDTNINVDYYVGPAFYDHYIGPGFYDCSIASEVIITADCPMFGIPAGENLLRHCKTMAVDIRSHYLVSYPDYLPLGVWEEGMSLGSYLAVGNVLPQIREFVVFAFDTIPEDMPESFTLSVSIPIHYSSWESFSWTESYGRDLLPEKRSLDASIEVKVAM